LHVIAAVARIQTHRIHIPALIRREVQRPAIAPVLRHHVRLPPIALARYHVAAERHRPPALRAEPRAHLAETVDGNVHFAERQRTETVHPRLAAAVAAEVDRVVPGETAARAGTPKAIVTPSRAGVEATGTAAVIAARHRPREAQVITAEASRSIADADDR